MAVNENENNTMPTEDIEVTYVSDTDLPKLKKEEREVTPKKDVGPFEQPKRNETENQKSGDIIFTEETSKDEEKVEVPEINDSKVDNSDDNVELKTKEENPSVEENIKVEEEKPIIEPNIIPTENIETEKKTEPKNNTSTINNNGSGKTGSYLDFYTRVGIFGIVFIILLCVGTLLVINSFKLDDEKVIRYNETSNIDYKVYLLENEFYDREYLEKDMVYVASLIKRIDIDFNYTFAADEIMSSDFTYQIIGKLKISDSAGTNQYYEKEYKLTGEKTISMNSNTTQNIMETVSIDYDYYNTIANNFKSTFGVDTESKLVVYLQIMKNNEKYNTEYSLDSSSLMNVDIPLSQKAINIKLDYNEINETSNIIKNSELFIGNIGKLVVGVIVVIIAIIDAIKLLRLLNLSKVKRSAYDKYMDNIMKDYDRLIVDTTNCPSFNDKEVIKIKKFTELLDVRDNLKLPIMHYVVSKHQKSYFYILHNNTVYLNVIKSVDLEASSHEKA